LLPFDIALRRLVLGRGEWRKVAAWLRTPVVARPAAGESPRAPATPTLARLLTTRDRARDRWREPAPPPAGETPAAPAEPAAPARPAVPSPPVAAPPEAPGPAATASAPPRPTESDAAVGGTVGQLLRAKEAARRGRRGGE
ncbi:MAG TPA: hypothetical protein VFW96_00660, partial [Thermomicrobiales bacterium]|nr:hypothetical protein [Thermomicrobiales bacterium]